MKAWIKVARTSSLWYAMKPQAGTNHVGVLWETFSRWGECGLASCQGLDRMRRSPLSCGVALSHPVLRPLISRHLLQATTVGPLLRDGRSGTLLVTGLRLPLILKLKAWCPRVAA